MIEFEFEGKRKSFPPSQAASHRELGSSRSSNLKGRDNCFAPSPAASHVNLRERGASKSSRCATECSSKRLSNFGNCRSCSESNHLGFKKTHLTRRGGTIVSLHCGESTNLREREGGASQSSWFRVQFEEAGRILELPELFLSFEKTLNCHN